MFIQAGKIALSGLLLLTKLPENLPIGFYLRSVKFENVLLTLLFGQEGTGFTAFVTSWTQDFVTPPPKEF